LTLGQGSNNVSLQVADADCAWGYLDSMRGPISRGMTLVSSNWGGPTIDMSWLDGETGCHGNCGGSPSFSVSHIKYNTPREKNFFATAQSPHLSVQPPQNKIYTGNFEHQTHSKIFTDFEGMKSTPPPSVELPQNKIYTGNFEHQTHSKIFTDFEGMKSTPTPSVELPQNKIYTGNFEHQTHKKIFNNYEFMQH
jgi:hypothetical protein